MKGEWTPSGGVKVTLGDDAARHLMRIEQLGGACVEQVEELFESDALFREMRGNAGGDVVFTATKSHSDQGEAANFFKQEYGRKGQKGSLVLTIGNATLTFAGATLRSVVVSEINGVRWGLRYAFGVTTVE